MTKRLSSKTKPCLQTGVDLWAYAESSHVPLPEHGPGQQKRPHASSHRQIQLPIQQQIESWSKQGRVIPSSTPTVHLSFSEPKYGTLLKEKQKIQRFYANVSQGQFTSLYHQAKNSPGHTGQNFLSLLETRIDTVLFRSNFARSFFEARQMINHGHVLVDGHTVTSPSCLLAPAQVIHFPPSSYSILQSRSLWDQEGPFLEECLYLSIDMENLSCAFLYSPPLHEILYPFEINLDLLVRYFQS